MTHVVNRLQFDVLCSDEELSLNLRQNFAQTVQQEIAQIIDDVCSEAVGIDESIKIDRIEVEMGSFSPHTFGTDFKIVFRQKLQTELAKQLAAIPPQNRMISRLVSDTEMLLYFLSNGALPWFADEDAIDINDAFQNVAANHAEVLKSFFIQVKSNQNIWKRLAWQFNETSKEIVISLSDELKKAQEVFLSWVTQIVNKLTAPGSAVADFPDVETLKEFSNVNNITITNAPAIFAYSASVNTLQQVFHQHIEYVFKTNPTFAQEVTGQLTNITGISQAETPISANAEQGAQNDPSTQSSPDLRTTADDILKYAVKYAGIVLLAPFLKPFFTQLNLLNGKEWSNMAATFRAVHLLKFLATGQKNAPEYSLVFEKILCGLPADTPLPLDIVLNDEEITESESLLKAVITHWSVLKNTSIDGLRESFIKRDGLLTRRENGWLLQVERKTLDVLIDSIPWGFSTITLIWTPDLIFVEW
ncbi:contractile injection system tape measure protein [Mucilaginibacter flavus]|uniref:contractile injection system tape measure protein n=1 Tax=Mucilaginibacter flavus TaxID=931504 RepID=UPI0025B54751|nr:contractile injection system tape measure protein [Mucilaginibacter flavus]MDN3581249.1 contractile injection system tape measure protein [Mucilaginibacter flavus]